MVRRPNQRRSRDCSSDISSHKPNPLQECRVITRFAAATERSGLPNQDARHVAAIVHAHDEKAHQIHDRDVELPRLALLHLECGRIEHGDRDLAGTVPWTIWRAATDNGGAIPHRTGIFVDQILSRLDGWAHAVAL